MIVSSVKFPAAISEIEIEQSYYIISLLLHIFHIFIYQLQLTHDKK